MHGAAEPKTSALCFSLAALFNKSSRSVPLRSSKSFHTDTADRRRGKGMPLQKQGGFKEQTFCFPGSISWEQKSNRKGKKQLLLLLPGLSLPEPSQSKSRGARPQEEGADALHVGGSSG